MITDDNNLHVHPNAETLPDDEERFLCAAVEALQGYQFYLSRIAEAREARGLGNVDLAELQDFALDMIRGLDRAIARRRRDIGTLLRNKRCFGQAVK